MQNSCLTVVVMMWRIFMDNFHNEHFDASRNSLFSLCHNEKEEESARACMLHIKEHKQEYQTAVECAPKYPNRIMKKFNDAISGKSRQEIEDIYLEWSIYEPLYSNTLNIKIDVWNWCEILLADAGIGKKRRNEKFRPRIYSILTSPHCLMNRDERATKVTYARLWENKLKKSSINN